MKTLGMIGNVVREVREVFGVGLAIGLLMAAPVRAADIYVSTNATPAAPYNTWANAFTNLQEALEYAASEGGISTIHVAGQTFLLTDQITWTTSDLTIRGGYQADPGGASPGTHNPELWPTVLARSGEFDHRIMHINGADNSTLEDVTITNGRSVSANGGGLYIENSQGLILSGCGIVSNRCVTGVRRGGGGLHATGSDVTLTNCLVRGNVNAGTGAGSRNDGGGIWSDGILTIRDSRIVENYVSRTHASGATGGALTFSGTTLTMENCLVVANNTETYHSAIWLQSGTANIKNCTVANNGGRGIFRNTGTVNLINSIVWGNGLDIDGGVNAIHSLIGDADLGGNNLTGDPLFEYGYYLAAGSPAIGEGSDTAGALDLAAYTTRTDGMPYANPGDTVNLGFHYLPGSEFDLTWADVYVCATEGDDANNGLSENEPFRTIGKALDVARDGTRIHVATGHYVRAEAEIAGEVFPLDITSLTGVRILGAGADETILDADGAERRIFTFTYAPQTVVSGLTLTGASFDFNAAVHGGGLYIEASQRVLVSDCVISNNTVIGGETFGGGLYAIESDVTVSNSLIQDNHSTQGGGGTRKARGGGLFCAFGRLTVLNSKILDNTSDSRGSGGGIWFSGMAANLRNVLISGNYASSGSYSDAYRGSGLWVGGGTVVLENCTMAGNVEDGISRNGGTVHLLNSIVWGNTLDIDGAEIDDYVTASHANIGTGGFGAEPDGDGNLSADPLFVNPGEADYRLQHGSPSINAGLNQDWMIGATDLAGLPRILMGRVDIGCYETIPPGGTIILFR